MIDVVKRRSTTRRYVHSWCQFESGVWDSKRFCRVRHLHMCNEELRKTKTSDITLNGMIALEYASKNYSILMILDFRGFICSMSSMTARLFACL